MISPSKVLPSTINVNIIKLINKIFTPVYYKLYSDFAAVSKKNNHFSLKRYKILPTVCFGFFLMVHCFISDSLWLERMRIDQCQAVLSYA